MNKKASKYQKREWGMYINSEQKAINASPLTIKKLNNWYSKYIVSGADVTNDYTYQMIYSEPYIKYQNIIDNYSIHWLAVAKVNSMYSNIPEYRHIYYDWAGSYGIRMLITLSPEIALKTEKTGTKTLTGGHMNTYGGNQTYNCWSISTNDMIAF